jgi:hypothetical protein
MAMFFSIPDVNRRRQKNALTGFVARTFRDAALSRRFTLVAPLVDWSAAERRSSRKYGLAAEEETHGRGDCRDAASG